MLKYNNIPFGANIALLLAGGWALCVSQAQTAIGGEDWDDLVAGLEKILVEGRATCLNAVSRFKS
jgi:hypothetical protein